MNKDLILAIDQGTTGTTCLLVDKQLQIVSRATREFPQHFPRPGWVEHDPDEIWASVCGAISDLLDTGKQLAGRILAIGITNQRETSLVWQRSNGKAVHRALVWQDRRTADVCQTLKDGGHEQWISQTTGLRLDPYFSGTKYAWILDDIKDGRKRAMAGELAAGTVDSFLIWKLTGGKQHLTDVTNASRTLLWPLSGQVSRSPVAKKTDENDEIGAPEKKVAAKGGSGTQSATLTRKSDWDPQLCRMLTVPIDVLPSVLDCSSVFGIIQNVPGLPDGIPICGVIGDQQAALFAQMCFEPGEAKCTFGTGAFVMLNTGKRPVLSTSGLLTTVGWHLEGQPVYCLEGSSFMAGAVVQWLRDGLGIIKHAGEIEALAQSVPDSGGVVVVPAHAGLGAPYWRPSAKGLICGLTRGTTKAHIARAALECIALQVADLLDAMVQDTGVGLKTLKVDGGASANNLLMQLQSDLLTVPLDRPQNLETTAMGAAGMAGLGAGLWPNIDALKAARSKDKVFKPEPNKDFLRQLRENWKKAVNQA